MTNNLLPYEGEVYLYPRFIELSNDKLQKLIDGLQWRNDKIKMFGKTYDQARKVAWYGDKGIQYKYSGIEMKALEWNEDLKLLKDQVEKESESEFNSVLVNYYRNGHDHMSYHTDNEKELGKEPCIASLSFGSSRDFYLKNISSEEVVKVKLGEGDLLIMKGTTQEYWKHAIPKRKRHLEHRLNLTFRYIYSGE